MLASLLAVAQEGESAVREFVRPPIDWHAAAPELTLLGFGALITMLDIAKQQGFHHLVVVEQGRIGEDLHAGLAFHVLVDALGQHGCRVALGMAAGSNDVRELDDHFAIVAARFVGHGLAGGEGECESRNGAK